MVNSSSLNFAPVLHNITPDKVIFCYRDGDSESLDVAKYYQSKRLLPDNHLIPLLCSDSLYITEDEYLEQIENPLISKLQELGQDFTSSGQKEIWVIILGFRVPIAFYSNNSEYGDPYSLDDLIAISSRLHRLGHIRENAYPNPVYDRRGDFKYFDGNDAQQLFITSVITGPSSDAAKSLIDRSIVVDNLSFVTGKIFIDPYGKNKTDDQLQYQNDLLDFIQNELPNLGLDSVITVPTFDGSDPFIKSMEHDAFYFGWFTPRYSSSLFMNQNEKRVFLYNADSDSAAYLNQPLYTDTSNPWCNLAININPGYALSAGSVSDPGESSYLRPRPFFESLHRGASIGEAFLFSSPTVDWKTILIGDPMLVVNFPVDLPPSQDLSNNSILNTECIRIIKEVLEESIAYGRRQERLLEDVVNIVVSTTDISEELNLLEQTSSWRDVKNMTAQNDIIWKAVDAFLNYILKTENQTFETWLELNNEKTTQFMNELLFTNSAQGFVSDEFIHSEGTWEYEFVYIHMRPTLENVHFEIQVSRMESFSDLNVVANSYLDSDGWSREIELNTFAALTENGLPSNFSGRRVRFEVSGSSNLLIRTEVYFVRFRALDHNGVPISDWITSEKMIIKR